MVHPDLADTNAVLTEEEDAAVIGVVASLLTPRRCEVAEKEEDAVARSATVSDDRAGGRERVMMRTGQARWLLTRSNDIHEMCSL